MQKIANDRKRNDENSIIPNTTQEMATSLNRELVIGLGQLGLPVPKFIKEQEQFDVYGMTLVLRQWTVHKQQQE